MTMAAAYRVEYSVEEYGAIEVYKKDPNGNKLSGAKFKVANQSHTLYIGPTDANGYAKVDKVPYGTYTVTETVFPTGYEASGQTSWTVTVGATTQKVTINAVNKKKPFDLKIQKVVNLAPSVQQKFGFEIKRSQTDTTNLSNISKWAAFDLAVAANATSSGYKVYEGCSPDYYYYIRETSTSGNTINEAGWSGGSWITDTKGNRWYKFKPSPGATITITASNSMTGDLKLKKVTDVPVGEDTTFTFKIERLENNVWESYGTKSLEVKKGSTESEYIFPDCSASYRYRIKETGCPSDWEFVNFSGGSNGKQNGDWYEFGLRPGDTVTITGKNNLKTVPAKFRKTIADASKLPSDSNCFTFTMYKGDSKSNDSYMKFWVEMNKEGAVTKAKDVTNSPAKDLRIEDGCVILSDALPVGTYTIRENLTETDLNKGFIPPTPITFVAGAKDEPVEISMQNTIAKGSMYVRKTADDLNPGNCTGFKFLLAKMRNGKEADIYASETKRGIAPFEDALTINDASGEYSFRLIEVRAKEDYILPVGEGKCKVTDTAGGKWTLNMQDGMEFLNDALKNNPIDTGKAYVEFSIDGLECAYYDDGYYLIGPDNNEIPFEDVVISDALKLSAAALLNIAHGDYGCIFSVHNELQKGQIEIHKTGETFSSVTSADGVYTPVYAENALEGAKFAIFAAEDIIVNGRTVYEKGEQVGGNLVTDENGIAVSEELYLGKYTVKEIDAPDGYILAEEQTVELTAENTTQRVTTEIVEVYNERVKVKVILPKTMQVVDSNGVKHGENGEIKNVVFGLYANENITAADGTFIPQGGLIETATVNVLGSSANFEFNADLPYGKYYIKEISTDSAYMLHDTTYGFEFSVTDIPADDLTETVEIQLDGIENRALGDIVGLKKDINGELVPGCEFQLYATTEICDAYGNRKYAAGDKVGGTVFSDKNGRFGWSGLYYGTYEIVEVSVPEGYVLPELAVVTDITINYRNTVQSVEVTNDYTKVSFLKTDENGNPLAGAEFALYRREDYENDSEKAKPIATWVSTTEAKLFEKLAFGDYVVIETKAPQGYTLCGTPEYFTVENSGETIEISLPNRPVLKVLSGGKGFFPQTLVGVALVGLGAILFTYGFRTKKKKTSR